MFPAFCYRLKLANCTTWTKNCTHTHTCTHSVMFQVNRCGITQQWSQCCYIMTHTLGPDEAGLWGQLAWKRQKREHILPLHLLVVLSRMALVDTILPYLLGIKSQWGLLVVFKHSFPHSSIPTSLSLFEVDVYHHTFHLPHSMFVNNLSEELKLQANSFTQSVNVGAELKVVEQIKRLLWNHFL